MKVRGNGLVLPMDSCTPLKKMRCALRSSIRRRTLSQIPFLALLLLCAAAKPRLEGMPVYPLPAKEECVPGQECSAAELMWGMEFLLDEHTNVIVEGTEAEVRAPGFDELFLLTLVDAGDDCAVLGWQPRGNRRRVWDAFTFFNEVDVLEVRLNTLEDVVDTFVISE
ncbi:hypothetical protein T484DRAFT_1908482, partial [Baffinella frigidus]